MGNEATSLATLERKLATFDATRFNVLHPILTVGDVPLSRYLAPSVSIIEIHPDAGETYQSRAFHKQDEMALSAAGLGRLALAASVKWVYSREIQGSRASYQGQLADRAITHVRVQWEAAGAIRLPNGEMYVVQKSKTIDTGLLAERLWDDDLRIIEKGWNKDRQSGRVIFTEADIPGRVRQQILQIRDNLEQLAETKAQNRVLRMLLAVHPKYTKAEIVRPFVVPNMVFRPDLADPLEVERIQIGARQANRELYGADERPFSSVATDRGTVVEHVEPEERAAAATAQRPHEGSRSAPPSAEGEVAAAASGAKAEPPPEPKEDPFIDDIIAPDQVPAAWKGWRVSQLALEQPNFVRGLAAAAKAKKTRELLAGWLNVQQPSLGV